jgi:hypothetical protein
MYVWLWRHLPGPLALRVVQAAVLLAGAVAVLMLVVFPRVEPLLPYQDVTVDPNPAVTQTPSH